MLTSGCGVGVGVGVEGGGVLRPFIKPICGGGGMLHLFSLHDVGVSSVFHKISPRSILYGQYLQIFIISITVI